MKKEKFIESLISKMSIKEKVGQCFVAGFQGSMIAPYTTKMIKEVCPAGLRVTPSHFRVKTAAHDPYAYGEGGKNITFTPQHYTKDLVKGPEPAYLTDAQYCDVLNKLKKLSVGSGAEIPVHITMDFEGNLSCDYARNDVKLFPAPMGLTRKASPQLAYEVAWAIGTQLVPIGVNWLHSPVLGVNTEPMNPEISARSYSDDPAIVAEYSLQTIKGFKNAGIIATGKHFPGRGASKMDAHAGLPVIDLPEAELRKHLEPFKACIDAGLPAIMTAHTVYPAYDDSGMPATMSKKIVSGLLKDELGFKGVVTSDSIEMGAILAMGSLAESILKTLLAGVDLILLRDEGGILFEVVDYLVKAVEDGRLPEERLNDALTRTLGAKYDYGILDSDNTQDPARASDGISNRKVEEIAVKAAKQSLCLIRDEQDILPIAKSQRILLIEQVNWLHNRINSFRTHPGIFWEKMLQYRDDIGMLEVGEEGFSDEVMERLKERLEQVDVIVTTHYHWRRMSYHNDFINKLYDLGKPVIVVTNNSYPIVVDKDFKTVISTYSVAPESLEEAAKLILGVDNL